MPKDTSIRSILIIGSGPIVIGQACEFDYSGSQAARSLKEEGIEVTLINSNPATIMTDPVTAHHIYLKPLTVASIREILEERDIDAVLPTMGGLLHMSGEERAALSNWRDVACNDQLAQRAASAMGVRYDGSKIVQSNQVKTECIAALRAACKTAGSYTTAFSELSQFVPDRAALRDKWVRAGVGLETSPAALASSGSASGPAFPLQPEETSSEEEDQAEQGAAAKSSSSPSSAGDAAETDLEQTLAEMEDTTWVAPVWSGRGREPLIHRLRGEMEGLLELECGRAIEVTAERFEGWRAVLTAPFVVCPECKATLPDVLQSQLG